MAPGELYLYVARRRDLGWPPTLHLICGKPPHVGCAESAQTLLPFWSNRVFHVRTPFRRLWLAAFLLSAFLTVQLAAIAYACAGSRYSVGGMADMAGMTESCPDMTQKAEAPAAHDGLCLEHCQLGSKSADHPSPQIPAFQPVLVNLVEPALVPVFASQRAAYADAVPRGPPRPLPILNCCFRT